MTWLALVIGGLCLVAIWHLTWPATAAAITWPAAAGA